MEKMHTVLGISLGTRQIGIAVIRNGHLLDWRTKSYPEKWSKGKVEKILSAIEMMIIHQAISCISCKVPDKPVDEVNQLLQELKKKAAEFRNDFNLCTLSDLKNKTENKNELMKDIVSKHPELLSMLKKEERNKHTYYSKMFEAVAAGYLFLQ